MPLDLVMGFLHIRGYYVNSPVTAVLPRLHLHIRGSAAFCQLRDIKVLGQQRWKWVQEPFACGPAAVPDLPPPPPHMCKRIQWFQLYPSSRLLPHCHRPCKCNRPFKLIHFQILYLTFCRVSDTSGLDISTNFHKSHFQNFTFFNTDDIWFWRNSAQIYLSDWQFYLIGPSSSWICWALCMK